MFNLQGGELMIILLLALVVLGPEKLPEAMRKLGKMYGEVKRMSSGFQEEFRSAVDEPMREFRKAVDEPMNEIRGTANALRDSADFRRFGAGERTEKPKSGEMAAITGPTEPTALLSPADAEAVPVAATPSFQPADGSDPDPGPVIDVEASPESAIVPADTHDGSSHVVPADVEEGSSHVVPADTHDGSSHVVPADVEEDSSHVVPADVKEDSSHVVPADVEEGSSHVVPADVEEGSSYPETPGASE